jgi:hypothetical protein
MRFISLYKHEKKDVPPSPELMAEMGKLIENGMKEGWLLATEGIGPNARPFRVRSARGAISVTDGPFAEAKEVIGGYAVMRASSREECIALCKRFLKVAGDGECEVAELYEPPAVPSTHGR